MSAVQAVGPPATKDEAYRLSLRGRRGSLFQKYALVFVILVGGALLTSSGIDLYFTYQETLTALGRLQRREALAAADSVERFIGEIEDQIAWAAQPVWAAGARADEER